MYRSENHYQIMFKLRKSGRKLIGKHGWKFWIWVFGLDSLDLSKKIKIQKKSKEIIQAGPNPGPVALVPRYILITTNYQHYFIGFKGFKLCIILFTF